MSQIGKRGGKPAACPWGGNSLEEKDPMEEARAKRNVEKGGQPLPQGKATPKNRPGRGVDDLKGRRN